MHRRRPVGFVIATVLVLCPVSAPAGAAVPYEVAGPPAAAPARARLPLASLDAKAGGGEAGGIGSTSAWARLQEDARALGLLPGDIPPERELDPLPEFRAPVGDDPAAASLHAAARHPSLTAVDAAQMELVAVRETSRLTFVHFRQRVEGLPVLGSKITFAWDAARRLRLAGARSFLPLPGASWKDDPRKLAGGSWISGEDARASALAGFPPAMGVLRWEAEERAWLPVSDTLYAAPRRPAEPPGAATGLLPVWRLRFRTADPDGWWEARVDGRTGALIERRSLVQDLNAAEDPGVRLQARATGWIEPMTAGDAEEERPFANLSLELRQTGRTVLGTTDAEGRFIFDARTPGACVLRGALSGPYIRVVLGSRRGETPAVDLPVAAPGEAALVWRDPVSRTARDAFYHANLARDVVRARDPGPALAPLDRRLDLVVDSPIGPLSRCNAWWDGEAIYFHEASDFCVSFARIAGVVYHEYGHALVQNLCGPFGSTPYLDEGWSDYFAASIQNDPRIGLGFVGPGTYFRELETDRVWPDDAHWDPHSQGLIIASTLWDLRRVLGPSLTDSLFHFACYGAAQNHEEYLLDMLAWDDDDGAIDNGTPHFEEIVSTFRAHGIGDEGVYLAFDPPADPVEGPAYLEVQASIRSPLYALVPEASGLHVRIGSRGEFSRLPIERSGHSFEYLGRIPLPAAGDTVYYFWRGVNAAGAVASLPSDAPASSYRLLVRRDATPPALAHRTAETVLEGRVRHRIRARARDESGRIGGVVCRYRVDPGGEERQVALAPLGDGGLYIGEIPVGPLALGTELRYAITAWDQATPPNETALPAGGVFHLPVRSGWGFDLGETAGSFTPAGDWAWGAPDDPALAFSGTRCWSTGLRGSYGANSSSSLVWGPVDLRGFDRASLRLRHLYRTEEGRDGGRVEFADGPVPDWTLLTPAGGYPGNGIAGLGPAYNGRSDDYEEAVFPLDRLLGRRVYFRFRFESDGQGQDRGWFLDDVRLMREQARVEPAEFEAQTGQDGKVTLRWRPPAGVDTSSSRFLGYHLYRTVAQAQFASAPYQVLPPRTGAVSDRAVVNGVTYRYRLHAVYDEGESPGLVREATPNPGRLSLPVAELGLIVRSHASLDTALALRNAGRGELLYRLYLGRAAASLPEVRAVFVVRVADPPEWIPVLADPRDPGRIADLRSLEARVRADSTGRRVEFALRGHGPWADPELDWGGALLIDTDLDPTTGIGGPARGWDAAGNVGAEACVLFGRFALQAEEPAAAILLAGPGRERTVLREADLRAGPDRITFAVPLELLGDPEQIQVAALFGRTLAEPPFDEAPESPEPWLRAEPRGGVLPPHATQTLRLSVDPSGLPNGDYHGCLVVDSNDRESGWRRLPVELRVDRDLPADLASMEFRSLRSGLEGSFRLRPEVRPDSVVVEREAVGAWTRVSAWGSVPGPDGRHVFLDRVTPPRVERVYRIRVSEGTRGRTYGPYPATWNYAPPAIEPPALISTEEGVRIVVTFPRALAPVRAVRLERRFGDEDSWSPLEASVSDSSTISALDRWSGLREGGPAPDRLCVYRFQVDTAAEDSLSYGPYELRFRPPVPARLELHPPRPNPFRDRTLLRLDLPAAAPVRLEVFGLDGRRRAVLVQREMPAGVHQLVWDGRGDDGRPLPGGAYWLRLETERGRRVARALRLR